MNRDESPVASPSSYGRDYERWESSLQGSCGNELRTLVWQVIGLELIAERVGRCSAGETAVNWIRIDRIVAHKLIHIHSARLADGIRVDPPL